MTTPAEQSWSNNVMLSTGKDVGYGAVAHHVLNICDLWKKGKRFVIEDIVTMLQAEEQGIEYSCPILSLEILKGKNFLNPMPPNHQALHTEAERVARAMLSDYMRDRKNGLKNPLPLNHRLYEDVQMMMTKILKGN